MSSTNTPTLINNHNRLPNQMTLSKTTTTRISTRARSISKVAQKTGRYASTNTFSRRFLGAGEFLILTFLTHPYKTAVRFFYIPETCFGNRSLTANDALFEGIFKSPFFALFPACNSEFERFCQEIYRWSIIPWMTVRLIKSSNIS